MYSTQCSPAMSPEDMQILHNLASRYGSSHLASTLQSMSGAHTSLRPPPQHHHHNNTARNSVMSTSTFGTNNSAPSLTSSGPWTSSDASLCDDAASVSGSFFTHSEPALLLSPSDTPSLAGSEWQDACMTPSAEKKAAMMKSPSRKPIECPICAVYDVYVGFGRKSDFKKHLQNFHNTDCVWVCPKKSCRMIFDFEKAYVTHFKIEHDDAYPPADQVKQELCPQVVFACGFIGCKEVFEAPTDTEASSTVEKYFDHLAGHFDKRSVTSEWTYYQQIQNLLRQRSLKDEWKHTLWDKTARNQLRWQPRSSGDFKKLLECRHLLDVPKILHAAWTLGQTSFSSPEHPAPEFPGEATRPLRGSCVFSTKGHSELHTAHYIPAGPQTMFSLKKNLFPVNVATVSHPPQRVIPDEPDSLEYPHPGTALVLPERDDWSTNLVLGPPEDEELFDPMLYPGSGVTNAIAPWSQSMGDLSAPTDTDSSGPLLRVPKQKRSWGKRSFENLRRKRRGVDEKTAANAWI
ncbi:uncharacterized protein CTRU02_208503 [Colletotrichum truncatum]|uniref:Uncharacterized protein n=1 Tax=Colletotrichum truncatum TaxID=5467 RepID=A0ACC3YWG9_COLTU|nr:uncharacterized protein CTRU02_10258 [Colletotrichum truncatum]KAF6787462.1 hypothetical protein CTRU02_10258 [Colletotrichum truncatum]